MMAEATIYGFALVLFRAAGLVAAAPVLGTQLVPMRVRLALAAIAAFAAFSAAGAPSVPVPASLFGLAGAVLIETVVGLGAGFAARMLLDAAGAAGQVAGVSMGFGYGALIDPVNGASSTALGQFLSMAALGFAVALGLHREAIAWLARSVIEFPPGGAHDLAGLVSRLTVHAIGAVALAVRLAFPILAAITFGHLALGVSGRLAQQLNLSSIGFSVAILAGGAALWLVAPHAAELAARSALAVFGRG